MESTYHTSTIKKGFDKLECEICKTSLNIEIHHKDGNRRNNDKSNLTPLCHFHHRLHHQNLNQLNKKGINLICSRCNYAWIYIGKNSYYATCPHCLTKVKVIKEEINNEQI